MEAVFEHWLQKRIRNANKPLIKRLENLLQENVNLVSSQISMKYHLNSNQLFMKLVRLRQELERMRTMLDLVKKRETVKRDLILVRQNIYEVGRKKTSPVASPRSRSYRYSLRGDEIETDIGVANSPEKMDIEEKVPESPKYFSQVEDTKLSDFDIDLIKRIIHGAHNVAGDLSVELPKHDRLSPPVTKKEYKRGLKILKDLRKVTYLAGGSGGGSKYIVRDLPTLGDLTNWVDEIVPGQLKASYEEIEEEIKSSNKRSRSRGESISRPKAKKIKRYPGRKRHEHGLLLLE